MPITTSISAIKRYIVNNIFKLLFKYYQHLFICDYMLWIYKQKGELYYRLIHKKTAFPYPYTSKTDFRFTRKADTWKESTTVKYKNISIREFQIHNNRNCIKFRFHFKNVLQFLPEHQKNQVASPNVNRNQQTCE